MPNISYTEFENVFNKLSSVHQFIIFHMVQNMEHINVETEINYSREYKIALQMNDMSINDLADELVGITESTKGKPTTSKENSQLNIRNTIASIIIRGTKNTDYFDDILDALGIDEEFLIRNTEHYQKGLTDLKWCFEHLSKQNRHAVYMLTVQLADIKKTEEFIKILTGEITAPENLGG